MDGGEGPCGGRIIHLNGWWRTGILLSTDLANFTPTYPTPHHTRTAHAYTHTLFPTPCACLHTPRTHPAHTRAHTHTALYCSNIAPCLLMRLANTQLKDRPYATPPQHCFFAQLHAQPLRYNFTAVREDNGPIVGMKTWQIRSGTGTARTGGRNLLPRVWIIRKAGHRRTALPRPVCTGRTAITYTYHAIPTHSPPATPFLARRWSGGRILYTHAAPFSKIFTGQFLPLTMRAATPCPSAGGGLLPRRAPLPTPEQPPCLSGMPAVGDANATRVTALRVPHPWLYIPPVPVPAADMAVRWW